MTLDDYQSHARETNQIRMAGAKGTAYFLLGFFGEVGTLLSALKKKQRDTHSILAYEELVIEEFGDCLWYLTNLASHSSIRLFDLANSNQDLYGTGNTGKRKQRVTLSDLQTKKRSQMRTESEEFEIALIRLGGTAGSLLHDFHTLKYERNDFALRANLVEVLRSLIDAADVAGVDLDRAAIYNVAKINSRWPKTKTFHRLFDDGYKEREAFPRRFTVQLTEEQRKGRNVVIQEMKGMQLGDPVTDNRIEEDDYRFHDVFHIAYAAILGWSPVLRALMRRKRKSNSKIDEAEDGARARLIEESVSAVIFQYASRLEFFRHTDSVDYTILKLIPDLVRGSEVESCPLWQWEKAILEGFAAFRQFQVHRKGLLVADLKRRSVTFKKSN